MEYLSRKERSDLARLMSPHAVTDRKDMILVIQMEMVFVAGSDQSFIRLTGDFQA
jgi:hypothetical protein